MSKEIEKLQNQLYISDKAHQRVCAENVELEKKIEDLQKEVERLRNYVQRKVETRDLKKYAELENENTKLKTQLKKLERPNHKLIDKDFPDGFNTDSRDTNLTK